MRARSSIRISGAAWFFPVVFALGVYIARADNAYNDGYAVKSLASASGQVFLVGPLTVAFTALQLRGFGAFLGEQRPRRTGLASIGAVWWPLLAGPALASLVACLAGSGALPRDRAGWSILAVLAATVLACGVLGALLVRVLPVVLAVPLGAVAAYAWLALPASGVDSTVRNLDSSFAGCCRHNEQPAGALVVGSLLVVGAVILTGVLLSVSARWTAIGRTATALAVCAGLALGFGLGREVVVTHHPNLLGVSARTSEMTCGVFDGIDVCVWPEYADRRAEVAAAAVSLNAVIPAVGLPLIAHATQDRPTGAAVAAHVSGAATGEWLLYSLAYGVVQRDDLCSDPFRRMAAVATTYLTLLAGVPRGRLAEMVAADELRDAEAVLANGPDVGARWLDHVRCRPVAPAESTG